MDKPLWIWIFFFSIIAVLLLIDLGIFHKTQKEIKIKESLWMSFFYIVIGIIFGGWIWYELGSIKAQEYITGLMIEKSLSLDNIFVISLIFRFFGIPKHNQHRVLFFGILGVIILRALMIGIGEKLITEFNWILHVFSAFLILTGIKMIILADHQIDLKNNFLLKVIKSIVPVSNTLKGNRFFIKKSGKLHITPMFVSLLMIEFSDLMFAIDSIPAIFSITTDPYIIYTSNIFAILGLRSLYFALNAIIYKFIYLKYTLALILIFIGSKTFIAQLLDINKIPTIVSLSVTAGLLILGILLSIYKTKTQNN